MSPRLEHATEWRPEDFIEVIKQSRGPTQRGTRYQYVTRRHFARGEWVIDGLLRPHWLHCESPPARLGRLGHDWGSEEYALVANGAHTRLAVALDVHFSGPVRFIEPYLTARMERRLESHSPGSRSASKPRARTTETKPSAQPPASMSSQQMASPVGRLHASVGVS
jgi:hypothetical protein